MPNSSQTILILDKSNQVAGSLSQKLVGNASVVVVTREKIEQENGVIVVPFLTPIPQIPSGQYTGVVFVWEKSERHLLMPLAQKATELGAHFFVICKNNEWSLVEEEKKKTDHRMSVLVVGDLFGIGESLLDTYLQKAKSNRRISLPHMGLRTWHPILFSDAIEKMAEIIHSKSTEGQNVFIGPSHQVTSLSLFHGIQKIEPTLAIDFSSENEEEKEYARCPRSVFESYDSIGKIQKYFLSLTQGRKQETKEVATIVFTKHPKRKNYRSGALLYIFYILLLLLSLPLLVCLGSGGVGIFLLHQAISESQKGNLPLALQEIRAAEQNLTLSQSSLDIAQREVSFIGQEKTLSVFDNQLSFALQGSKIVDAGLMATQTISLILSGKTLSPQDDAYKAVGALKNLSLLVDELPASSLPKKYQNSLSPLQVLLQKATGLFDEIPQVLGVNGDKTYLVLFQNNMELRPGGGFIGSYGILKLHLGAVKEFTIHDVYDADGQLKGHVEPPFAIRRYIPQVHLYLRDSNFDADFSQDAEIAAQMLYQETGERADGVIGVDLSALKGLLASVGSVYVPSYNQSVNEKNFFELIESHAEKNFFPGSTQKKDFLNAFASALIDTISHKKSLSLSTALNQTMDAILGKHVVVGFNDPLIEEPFNTANISGSLIDKRSKNPNTLTDFWGVSEANLGVNKDNAFVTRGLSQNITIDASGSMHSSSSLTLTNNSDGTWPGGVYRNYIRFVLPSAAVLDSIIIDGVKQKIVPAVTEAKIYEAKGFVPPQGLEVATEKEAGKTLYGFLVTIPEKKSMTIIVSYITPNAFSFAQQKLTYDMLLWKQPGVETYPYTVTITIPSNYKFLEKGTTDQSITFAGNLSKDITLSASFAQK